MHKIRFPFAWLQPLPLDPVEGFFNGIGSAVGRMFFVFVAVGAGSAVCVLSSPSRLDEASAVMWLISLPFMLGYWLTFGLWGLVGLAAVGTMVISLCSFVLDQHPKRNFFVAFAAAALYYAPLCFEEYRWIWSLLIFGVCAALYWCLPSWIAQLQAEVDEPEETGSRPTQNVVSPPTQHQPVKRSSLVSDKPGWRTVSTLSKYKDKNVEVTLQNVFTPTRQEKSVRWTVCHRKAAVVVAPMTAEGKLVLVQQERIPVRALMWEFPAGQIAEDNPDDEQIILATAKRELQEETGYELAAGAEMIPLGYFFTSQGFTDEHNYLFLAKGVVPSKAGASHDENEGITDCREFTLAEFRRMVADNEITNANTLSLYARLCAKDLV